MRYRRDIPRDLIAQQGHELSDQLTAHICQHLLGAAHPHDEPIGESGGSPITLYLRDHETDPTLQCLIGEIDAEPNAPYLRPDFDPAADHPEIVFFPHENLSERQYVDLAAWEYWSTHGHHERREP